jgi:hypothetical protein
MIASLYTALARSEQLRKLRANRRCSEQLG